ncbi:hypothetical protein [Hymenobacter cheonanensis]|uniref:hypothetical protein n=1 Tax=Hymenobacter sp. CA2-7 TaxID=3063993 RepID=UPI0027142A13|nr:hypothetical protein [Hymenobacter sp. CA2-7]MDO7888162.1 hypothetical protein [Hymenobacter sp. CA2-7]
MTYAPTVHYLKRIALATGAGSFWFGKEAQKDINYNAAFPQVHLFLMPAPLSGANVSYPVRLCFYGQDAQENALNLADQASPDNSLAIQDAMDLLSQQFVAALRDDEEEVFDVSDEVQRIPVLREGAQIGTGFFVSFTLTTRAAVC